MTKPGRYYRQIQHEEPGGKEMMELLKPEKNEILKAMGPRIARSFVRPRDCRKVSACQTLLRRHPDDEILRGLRARCPERLAGRR